MPTSGMGGANAHVDHILKLLFYATLWSLTFRGKSLPTLSNVGSVYAYKPSGKAKALLKTAHIIIAHISFGSRPPHRPYNACDLIPQSLQQTPCFTMPVICVCVCVFYV